MHSGMRCGEGGNRGNDAKLARQLSQHGTRWNCSTPASPQSWVPGQRSAASPEGGEQRQASRQPGDLDHRRDRCAGGPGR